ncbi:MAG: hypothetical protein WC455_14030 [Dehalococcoidia bacterium]|jgi:hypothetical protein
MAAQVGKDGFISFGSSSSGGTTGTTEKPTYIDTWSLNSEVNLADVTAFGAYSHAYLPTVRAWTATAGGTLDLASTEQQSVALLGMAQSTAIQYPLWLHMHDSTGKWIGKALLTSIAINSQVADKVGVTYSFQGTSGLAYV